MLNSFELTIRYFLVDVLGCSLSINNHKFTLNLINKIGALQMIHGSLTECQSFYYFCENEILIPFCLYLSFEKFFEINLHSFKFIKIN